MSAAARKLAEDILAGWTIITVQLDSTARLDSRHLVLARELLAALDREERVRLELDIVMAGREAAEVSRDTLRDALRDIDAEAAKVLWDLDGVSTEPMFDELAIKIIAAREALAAAEGQQT